jgi:splicing factor U2AF 65 kDa subunit
VRLACPSLPLCVRLGPLLGGPTAAPSPAPPHTPARTARSYAFLIFSDPSVTDVAIAGLNGLAMGDRNLTVRRANVPGLPGSHSTAPLPPGGLPALGLGGLPGPPPVPGAAGVSGANLAPLGAFDAMAAAAAEGGGATRVVALTNCVQREELLDDGEYAEIFQDMQVGVWLCGGVWWCGLGFF